jgi:O-antigen/teichoic acid export membrane protein
VTTTLDTHRSHPERLVRRWLRIEGDPVPGAVFDAQNKLRSSLVISGIRCIITYLLVPIATPIIGFLGVVAAPVSIALSVFAIVLGYNSLRRFWMADHRLRWRYTIFIVVVWLLLTVGIVMDIGGLWG